MPILLHLLLDTGIIGMRLCVHFSGLILRSAIYYCTAVILALSVPHFRRGLHFYRKERKAERAESKILKIKVTKGERVSLSGRVLHAEGLTPD